MISLLRLTTILVLSVVLAACASRSGFEPYVATTKDFGAKSYRLTNVSLKLSGDPATARYPDQAALQVLFADELRAALKEQSLEGARYELQVSVEWSRRLLGGSEEARDVFSSAGCQFESRILENGDVIATDAGDPLNANSIASNSKNFLNNLKRIKDSLARTGDPDSEAGELNRCVELLVERLPR